MKPATVGMPRAHLIAASLMAMAIEVVAFVMLPVLPVSQHEFSSTPFRLLALAAFICGIVMIRRSAQIAFDSAVQRRHVRSYVSQSRHVSVATNCPQRRLVTLHLRFSGRPFVVAEH